MIRRRQRTRVRRFALAWFVLCVGASAALAQSTSGTLAGLRLEEALRIVQTRGLRLVFSSELVTPEMRVGVEPRASSPRGQLDELLAPHGLAAERGPGGVIQIVRRQAPGARARAVTASPSEAGPPAGAGADVRGGLHRERVTVTASRLGPGGGRVGAARILGAREMEAFGSHVGDDPLRTVQALPGVAAADDFRSEYSVRGSAFRHARVIVDGVAAPWLQHAALGRGDTGTITMLRGDVIHEATLLVGAYPRRDAGQLGPQLSLILREGSRTAPHLRAEVSGTSASVTAEGPLGRSARGSWLLGLRRSHVEWPIGRDDHGATVFGFGDLQAKLVYDLRPGDQVSVSLVAGRSNIERDDSNPFAPSDGINRAALMTASWRSTIGSHTVVTQRVSAVTHDFLNRDQAGGPVSRGSNGAGAWRGDIAHALAGGVLEAGGQVRRVKGSRRGSMVDAHQRVIETSGASELDASWLERAGYGSYRRTLGQLALETGVRVADSTLAGREAFDRWLHVEWLVARRWLVHGSAGVTHQFPELEHVRGHASDQRLRPERATHADIGVGRQLSTSWRWNATLFGRRERDTLREPDLHPRLIDGVLTEVTPVSWFENGLTGVARGVELMLERRHPTGLAGWIGYTYGVARYHDADRHEGFAADFDQRHAINLSATAPLPWAIRAGVTFRGGTGFPIPAYLASRDGTLVAGNRRNQIRLPAYARLDLRAERTFEYTGRRLSLFVDALNVLNRANVGLSDGVIRRDTGVAIGFTEPLFPRIVTGGVRVAF
jgi:hypothetical protein